jgi:hypothetical protein
VLHSRRQLVPNHVHFAVLRNLPETRRRSAGLGVHVQRLEHRGLPLRLGARSAQRHVAKRGHLFGREKLPRIGPTFGALLGANLHQPVPVLDDRKFVAVLDRGGNGDFSANSCRKFSVLGPTYASPSEANGGGLSEQETRKASQAKTKYSASQCHERSSIVSLSVMPDEVLIRNSRKLNFIARAVTQP